jgi:hypothetical protein
MIFELVNIYNQIYTHNSNNQMATPTDNWQMKILKYLFGEKLIVRVETAYFIFKLPEPTP